MKRLAVQAFLCALLWAAGAQAAPSPSVYMEDLTWMEIRDRIQGGAHIAIIPAGGIEQNGPHMITGKHNVIVRYTAGEIAKRLGTALVAPVISFVPEGRIDPPEGHMQFPGTISARDDTFSMLLEDTAASLKQAGFTLICIIGDHGGSQNVQRRVADKLTGRWQSAGVRVLHVSDYYGNNGQDAWLQSIGVKTPNPGAHAGLADTSELMTINAAGIRADLRGVYTENDFQAVGAMGDSTAASPKYGRRLLSLKVEAAVNQITNAIARP